MAQEQENAKTAEAGAVLAEPSAATEGEALAEGIEALQAQALDGSEVSKQLEDLTGVVLSSAEVSTRSAEVAANISEEMRNVMVKVDDMSRRNVLHSRVMLVGLLSFLMIAVGTFFAISTRMCSRWRWESACWNSTPPWPLLVTPPVAWGMPLKNSMAWKSVRPNSTAKSKPVWKT